MKKSGLFVMAMVWVFLMAISSLAHAAEPTRLSLIAGPIGAIR